MPNALENFAEMKTHTLDGVFNYRMENPETISLHLGKAYETTVGEKLRALRNAFSMLARQLKNNRPHLTEVKTITATSWLVTERPKILEMLGFTIDNTTEEAKRAIKAYKNSIFKSKGSSIPENKRDIPASYAHINKDKFIELYL
ncbi:MAG TPA: hypothetical protein VGO63_00350 [Candidatus Paceibacterota bacterium]|jgi:hypothetical protein|nr:hypothetical protein [Candidatus Paceibacterota bacterium]